MSDPSSSFVDFVLNTSFCEEILVRLAEKFHTLALDGVPIFGLHNRTSAYRFVTLVDVGLSPSVFPFVLSQMSFISMC